MGSSMGGPELFHVQTVGSLTSACVPRPAFYSHPLLCAVLLHSNSAANQGPGSQPTAGIDGLPRGKALGFALPAKPHGRLGVCVSVLWSLESLPASVGRAGSLPVSSAGASLRARPPRALPPASSPAGIACLLIPRVPLRIYAFYSFKGLKVRS